MLRREHLLMIAVLSSSGTAWAAGQHTHNDEPAHHDEAPAPVLVKTNISQTALWVGDPLIYTIEITCPPGTDILADDISRERLRLTGLEISDANQQRETRPDGTIVHRAQFHLASFVTDGSPVRIDAQTIRYYVHTAGQRVEALVPSDEVELPAVDVAMRSTLPDARPGSIRDARPIRTLPSGVRFLMPAGVAAVMLSLAPVAVGLVAALARMRKPRRAGRSRWRSRRVHRRTLETIRGIDASADADARRDAFGQLNMLIRDYLTDLNIPALGLTSKEIEKRIESRTKRLPAGDVAAVLSDCERALYGGPDELPGPDVMSAALEKTNEFLSARVR